MIEEILKSNQKRITINATIVAIPKKLQEQDRDDYNECSGLHQQVPSPLGGIAINRCILFENAALPGMHDSSVLQDI